MLQNQTGCQRQKKTQAKDEFHLFHKYLEYDDLTHDQDGDDSRLVHENGQKM